MRSKFYLPVAILLLAVTFQNLLAQSTEIRPSRTAAGVDLRLHRRLSEGKINDVNISLLVKGDLKQIEALTLKYGGVYKNAYKDIASIEIPEKNVLAFAASQGIQKIENTSSLGRQLMDTSRIRNNVDSVQQGFAPLTNGLKGKDVVVGIIDGGFYFQHMDFKNPLDSTTRIKYIWDQQVSAGNVPGPYNYGTEWTAAQINNGTCTHVPPTNDFGHGTCVTGIAAGNGLSVQGTPHQGKYTGIAPEADIIAVRVRNGNNFFASVVDAVDYIFKKADSLGKPCVINTSVGDYWGSHDGLDLTSQAIDNMITAKNGRALVAAAGNGGNVPFHLSYQLQPDSTYTYFKRFSTDNIVYFDFWADTADFQNAYFAIGAHSSSGAYKGRTPYFNVPIDFNPPQNGSMQPPLYDVFDLSGNFLGTLYMQITLDGSRYQVEAYIDFVQNASDLWKLQMKGSGKFDLWASEAFTGSSDMTSSTTNGPITLPNYRHPDNAKTMVTSWQNSEKVITVGNYSNRASYVDYNSNTVNLLGAPYYETVGQRFGTSSLGPTRDNRVKPDVMATGSTTICTGDAIYISGLLGTAPEKVSVTGKHVRNGGTSMASPVVAGIVALYLQQNPTASYSEIKEALICTAKQDAFTGAVPNAEYGNGKVNAFAAITRPCNAIIYGSLDTSCLNYNPNSNTDTGCVAKVYGVMDTGCTNYNPLANVSGGVCIPKVYGVMDTACVNYNPQANVSGGVCSPKVYGVMDTACLNYNPLANVSGGVCSPKVYGIMDTACLNFNPNANVSGGTCVAKVYGITDTSCLNYNPQANISSGTCVAKVYGVTDTSCINYSAAANVDNGTCVAKVYGVMDTSCVNYNAAANINNGACVAKIYGVTDTSCINYNAAANIDNGACVAKIYGSLDTACNNYNALANVDNGCITGIDNMGADNVTIQVLPNPFNTQTTFVIEGVQFKTASIRIYNYLGALVDEFELSNGKTHYVYQNTKLAKAIYSYLLVADGKNIKAGKLVVE